MKTLNKILTAFVLVIMLTFGLTEPITTHAVTTAPNLGAADTYSVWGATGITGGAASTAWGNAGDNGTIDSSLDPDGTYHEEDQSGTVGDAITSARLALDAEIPTGTVDLDAIDVAVGPGVYTVTTTAFSKTLTLNGAGTYIFQRKLSNIAQTAGGTMVLAGGACASDIYWEVGTDMAFATGAGVNMYGTIIAGTTIAFGGSGLTLKGRALTDTQVTFGGFTINITEPVACAAAPASTGSSRRDGYINVVKTVINDNGGTKTVADFPLFVNGSSVVSGVLNRYDASTVQTYNYTVTETNDSNYTRTFSGDCSAAGVVTLNPYENKFCFITNNDIGAPVVIPPVPPLIEVLKVPSPLALPNGAGLVKYTYTLNNIGTVPVSDITMVGDTCSPIVLISGDTNNDAKLDVIETWVHTCSTTLTATHTNVITATGWANGISATDIASATVVVGAPIIPPLIHVVKVPSVFTLSAPGGAVTYTYTVTNPGTEPLSNVSIADDKCTGLPARVVGHPGDLNKNNLLESNETWTFTCKTKLTQTTTNTGTAQGSANGLIARDFSIATVVVAGVVPTLPNTGIMPTGNSNYWGIVIPVGILFIIFSLYLILKKREN